MQRAVISELEKIGIVHLYTLGFKGDDLVSFRLRLNNPSKIAELQELEHWKTKFDIAGGATENFFSRRWIAQNIFNLSEEEFVRNQREMYSDRKYEAELNAAAEAAGEAAAGAFGGEAEEGLDIEAPDEDIDTDLDIGGGEEDVDVDIDTEDEAPADDEPLLAAPAKRDDRNRRTTKNSQSKKAKGKKYVSTSLRGGDGRKSAGSRKNAIAAAVPPATQTGIPAGMDTLKTFSRGSIYELKQTTYNKEEQILFEANAEVKKLITDLEKAEIHTNENETQQKA